MAIRPEWSPKKGSHLWKECSFCRLSEFLSYYNTFMRRMAVKIWQEYKTSLFLRSIIIRGNVEPTISLRAFSGLSIKWIRLFPRFRFLVWKFSVSCVLTDWSLTVSFVASIKFWRQCSHNLIAVRNMLFDFFELTKPASTGSRQGTLD